MLATSTPALQSQLPQSLPVLQLAYVRERESLAQVVSPMHLVLYILYTHKKQWGAMQLTGSTGCACALPDNR